jgi:hypothetical protein
LVLLGSCSIVRLLTGWCLVREEDLGKDQKPIEVARAIVQRQCDGVLLPDVVLPFDGDEFANCTVADVLTGHDAGSTCAILEENNWKEQSGSFLNPGFPQSGSHPAVCLTQDDGNEYVAWQNDGAAWAFGVLNAAARSPHSTSKQIELFGPAECSCWQTAHYFRATELQITT